MWLRDQLPRDFPTVRCMIYGYDTKLVESKSFQSLDDLARSFIHHLLTIGRAEHSARPLILLGHSLGGILVKRALLYLAGSGEANKTMLSKIKLFIAFGVPNRGMRIDHLLSIVGLRPNKHLIESLAEPPPNVPSWLSVVDEQFSGIAQHYDIRVVSAFETETTPLTEMQSNGEAQRTGTSEILVQRDSAVQRSSRDPQDIFHINKNHSDMVKFERNDLNYFIVRNFVREIVASPDASEGGLVSERVSRAPASFLQNLRHHGKGSADPDDVVDSERLLKSLNFEESSFRFQAIERAHESTFGWIFEKAELGFIPWILKGTGVYWIRGKAGSGKSTFMKYLHNTEQLKEAIRARGTRKQQIDLWFFFNERGTYLQKSLDGLLRGMLANLASRESTIAELVLEIYRSKPRKIRDRWNFEDLKEAFAAVLTQDKHDLELTIFLDALDEYYGFPEVISQWILETVSTSRDSSSLTKVRFCFSSREWDSFVKAFSSEPGFVLQEHTYQDVEQYTISRLSRLTSQHPYTADDPSTPSSQLPPAEVVRLIATRAEGVFLWVKLAIDEIALSPTISSQEELETLISRLPADLEDFYMRTISRISKSSRWRAFTLLEIVSRSSDVVTPQSLFFASACALGNTFQECKKHLRNAGYPVERTSNDESISRDLLNLCGGFLECVDVDWRPPNTEQLSNSSIELLWLDNGYTFLLKYKCVLASHEEWPNPDRTLLDLAYDDERSTGRAATTFINSLPELFFYRPSGHNKFNCAYTSHFLFAVLGNLHLYVRKFLGDLKSHRNERPLNKIASFLASEDHPPGWTMDYAKMAQILLRHGFGVSDQESGLTPFRIIFSAVGQLNSSQWWRSSTELVNFARVLIQDGRQDPNELLQRGPSYRLAKRCSAIHASSARDMTQMLLENGADVNLRDSQGHTPLDTLVLGDTYKIRLYPEDVFDCAVLLLSHGGRLSRRVRDTALKPHIKQERRALWDRKRNARVKSSNLNASGHVS
ncbi:NACHT domain-containing protein [Cladophialophora immunda]|nr:NACHT domain-containing protein [Cladophialophora immunda]